MATTGERLGELMREAGDDQAALARVMRVTQGTISLILLDKTQRSRILPEIAEHYRVSLRWLRGEDVPRTVEGEEPDRSEPPIRLVSMPVALPSDAVLERMFEAMLVTVDLSEGKDALARELAKRLPTGLARLKGLLLEPSRAAPAPPAEDTEDPPAPRRAGRQGSST